MTVLIYIVLLLVGIPTSAQEVHQELQETVRATVLEIVREETRDIVGTDTDALVQEIRVRIQDGVRKNEVATFETDLMRLEKGDSIYVNRLISIDGVEYYTFKDADRRMALISLALCFVLILVAFSGRQGVRALLSLAVSVGLMLFILVPLLLKGYPPVLVSVLVACPMLAIMLIMTHGFRAQTILALLGTIGAIVVTGLLAHAWVALAHFTGLSDDAAIYLNFSTKGALDFGGLLLGSIIIGILGILDDVAITQASVVTELKRVKSDLASRELYLHALRVGRDHIGSLVNTLAFAYIGAALPLVLLLTAAGSDIVLSLNQEMVAVELVRIFVGSIGLILTVPFTTLIAVIWYERHEPVSDHEHHGHVHAV